MLWILFPLRRWTGAGLVDRPPGPGVSLLEPAPWSAAVAVRGPVKDEMEAAPGPLVPNTVPPEMAIGTKGNHGRHAPSVGLTGPVARLDMDPHVPAITSPTDGPMQPPFKGATGDRGEAVPLEVGTVAPDPRAMTEGGPPTMTEPGDGHAGARSRAITRGGGGIPLPVTVPLSLVEGATAIARLRATDPDGNAEGGVTTHPRKVTPPGSLAPVGREADVSAGIVKNALVIRITEPHD